jgi:hypothetical protein
MTEDDHAAAAGGHTGGHTGEHTGEHTDGHPAVDEVLRALQQLDDRPVEEHVPVFEEAHEALRRTLASADVEPADDPDEGRAAGAGDGPGRG